MLITEHGEFVFSSLTERGEHVFNNLTEHGQLVLNPLTYPQIIGKLKFTGIQDLYMYWKAVRQLNINLKGVV